MNRSTTVPYGEQQPRHSPQYAAPHPNPEFSQSSQRSDHVQTITYSQGEPTLQGPQPSVSFNEPESSASRSESGQRAVPAFHRHYNGSTNSEHRPMLEAESATRDPSSVELEPYPSSRMAIHRRRMATNLGNPDEAPVEVRHTHKYSFRRPRPLMVEHQGHLLAVGEHGKLDIEHPENSYHLDVRKKDNERHPDSLRKQRERLDIFVDLIWVGIIANIAEHFHDQLFKNDLGAGNSMGEFLLLFLPAWRIWQMLQHFLNSFYTDDTLQRALVTWILILGVVWGNNAPFLLEPVPGTNNDNWTITTYLLAVASFTGIIILYAYWLPWMRRTIVLSWLSNLPGVAMWIGATCVNAGTAKWILVSVAVGLNNLEALVLATPLADRLLGDGIRRAQDSRTMIRRYENFFIIALGEGVFEIIRGSPLVDPSEGFITIHLARGILVLGLFYTLNWVYFHGDMSKRYIHAMDRRWWIKFLWHLLHVPLFAALVILSTASVYLVTFPTAGEDFNYSEDASTPTEAESAGPSATSEASHRARGLLSFLTRSSEASASTDPEFTTEKLAVATTVACVSLAVVLCSLLFLAFLNRPVDEEKELRVTSRNIRMAPRAAAVVVLATVWLSPSLTDPTGVLGMVAGIVSGLAVLEQILGSPRDAKIFEPKEDALDPSWALRHEESRESEMRRMRSGESDMSDR